MVHDLSESILQYQMFLAQYLKSRPVPLEELRHQDQGQLGTMSVMTCFIQVLIGELQNCMVMEHLLHMRVLLYLGS